MKTRLFNLVIVALAALTVSCRKEIEEPKEHLNGKFALDIPEMLVDGYYMFNDEVMTIYESRNKYVFAENAFWNCSAADFEIKSSSEYYIRGGRIYVEGEEWGSLSDDGSTLVIGDDYYSAVTSFESECYSSISVESIEISLPYNAKTLSVPVTVNRPIPSGILTASCTETWLTNVTVADGLLTFTAHENYSSQSRSATIVLSYSSAANVTCTVTQDWTHTAIVLTPETKTVDCAEGTYAVSFEVVNPCLYSNVFASTSESWISNISVSDNTLSFKVAKRDGGKSRTGTISLAYGAGTTATTYAKAVLTVTQTGQPVTSLSLNFNSIIVYPKQGLYLVATVVPSDAELVWSSDHPEIATVNSSGIVTGVAIGNATVTVASMDGAMSATCSVQVVRMRNNLTLTPSWDVNTGLTYGTEGTITISNPSGGELSISSPPNANVATASAISNNMITITPVGVGMTNISIKSEATDTYEKGTKSVTIRVYTYTSF